MNDGRRIDVVLKIGGALLRDPAAFSRAALDFGQLATSARVVIVPGGGPFADAVRDLDRRLPVSEESAHWMAILAMDQYAHLIVAHAADAVLVEDETEASTAIENAGLPVLAPYRWLRTVDPLPHSWDVTSDSVAAWIAGVLGARHLVLLKPVASPISQCTDPYFARALTMATDTPPEVHVCTGDTLLATIAALSNSRAPTG